MDEPTLVDVIIRLRRHWRVALPAGFLVAMLATGLLRPRPPLVEVLANVEVGRVIAGDQPVIIAPPTVLVSLVNDAILPEALAARRHAGRFAVDPSVRMPDGGSILTFEFIVPTAQVAEARAFAEELRTRVADSLNSRVREQKQEFGEAIAFLADQQKDRLETIETIRQRLANLEPAPAGRGAGDDAVALQGLIIAEMRRDSLYQELINSREALLTLARELRLLRYQDASLRLTAPLGPPVDFEKGGGRSWTSSLMFGVLSGLFAAVLVAYFAAYLQQLRERSLTDLSV